MEEDESLESKASEPKRRRIIKPPPRRIAASAAITTDTVLVPNYNSTVLAGQPSGNDVRIQQAKKYAVAQAKQDGSTGNYRNFNSPFGNFLVPVIPTCEELADGCHFQPSAEKVHDSRV